MAEGECMNSILSHWNSRPAEQAQEEVLPCNGSRRWAAETTQRRPFASTANLLLAADTIWAGLDERDWNEAFASHPRLGEQRAPAATAASLAWSAREQSELGEEAENRQALAEGNRLYEQRFGRVFLACATGKSAADLLALLRSRLGNDPATELLVAAEHQRRITQLRLRKWLDLPPARCEDV